MKIGIAQIDTRIGDLDGNMGRIRAAHAAARNAGAELVVYPELVVTGYPPRDLLFDDAFVEEAIAATDQLARALSDGPAVVLGNVARAPVRDPGHPGLYDAAILLDRGRVVAVQAKRLLPAYDVFHEPRWFVPGERSVVHEIAGEPVGLVVCEDLWDEGYSTHPIADLRALGAKLVVCISASPYRDGVRASRLHHAQRAGVALVYANIAGANDELVFDGASFVSVPAAHGTVVTHRLARFAEEVAVVDVSLGSPSDASPAPEPDDSREDDLFAALVSGVRGFSRKNGIRHAVLGLSGGIDSALVACIAKEALGAERVTAVALPSRFTDDRSTECARELAARLGIHFAVVPIEALHTSAEATLAPAFADDASGGIGAENVQARLRMIVLMSFVNARGGMLLNTSNKTELTLGYGTLYADLAGTLCVLGDLTKPDVYAVAKRYDAKNGHPIPRFVIDRPPSAELRADQVDPFDYPRISPIAEALVRGEPIPSHATADEIERCRRLYRSSEHKRWQSGIVLKVSEKAFGTGRMLPVTATR